VPRRGRGNRSHGPHRRSVIPHDAGGTRQPTGRGALCHVPRSGQEDVRSPGARNQVARAFEGARVRPSGESTAGSRAPRAAIGFDAVPEAREPERSGSCLAQGPTRLMAAASSTGDHALQLRRGSANAARRSLATLARRPSSALSVGSEGAPAASDRGCSVDLQQRKTSGVRSIRPIVGVTSTQARQSAFARPVGP
jgi:hypothetical protein